MRLDDKFLENRKSCDKVWDAKITLHPQAEISLALFEASPLPFLSLTLLLEISFKVERNWNRTLQTLF